MPPAKRVSSGPQIGRDPAICGGEPTIAGTRAPVRSVVVQWQNHHDVQRVQSAFPRLDAAGIEKALRFYNRNRAEIDRLIEENDRAAYGAD